MPPSASAAKDFLRRAETVGDHLQRLAPGVLLCIAITFAAYGLERVETAATGEPYLEALVLAILIGVAVRTAWKPGPRWNPGIDVSAKFVLECAIVMLGASVSAATIMALGLHLIVGIAVIVSIGIGASYLISRALGLPQRLSILIAAGNSICGNSAIAAVAPVIGADGDDIASSISFTAVLGVIVVLTLPLLVPLLQLSLTQYGVLAGLTVYAVPQVLAATLPVLRSRGLTALPVTYIGKAATFALMSGFPLILLGQWDALWSRVVLACGWAFLVWGLAMYLWSGVLYLVQVTMVVRQLPKVSKQ